MGTGIEGTMNCTVHYRDKTKPPRNFRFVRAVDDTNPAVLLVRESISYGDTRATRIPWDLIERVETA
jgi:hypothetical protein